MFVYGLYTRYIGYLILLLIYLQCGSEVKWTNAWQCMAYIVQLYQCLDSLNPHYLLLFSSRFRHNFLFLTNRLGKRHT